MPDHHANPSASSPESLLDDWLDAINDPARLTLPEAPEEIVELAAIAERYHDVLGMTHGITASHAVQERNGSMPQPARIDTDVAGLGRTVAARNVDHRRRSWARLSSSLTNAVLIGLLIMLAGGMVLQYGPPAGFGGLFDTSRLMAPGSPTPGSGALSCAAPGYRPIIEGEGSAETLETLGITDAPIVIDDGHVTIPTSSGETVTLPRTWTPVGGPLWADMETTDDGTTIRNIETGEDWTSPDSDPFFPGFYHAPYLFVPATSDRRDWRIIDTVTGEERLVSEIRGEPFPDRVEISSMSDPEHPPAAGSTSVWLFSSFSAPAVPGPNALVLPASLADAAFMPDTVDATYFHELAYSPATQQIAFATGDGLTRSIVVVDPQSGARIVVQDERFTGEALPLMFSDDGSSLVVDQPGTLFSVSLAGEPEVKLVYQGEKFVPVAHNARSMNVVVMFEDRHIAMIDAQSGEATDLPLVIVPENEYWPEDPKFRMSTGTQVLDLFDDDTGTVRFINLVTGSVSPDIAVLNPGTDFINAPIQPEFEMVVQYPLVTWAGGYAFLDEHETLHAVSAHSDKELLSIPPPDDFSVASNQAVNLLVPPGGRCVVLNVVQGAGVAVIRNGVTSDRVTTWVAPLEPGAQWTRLESALVGWWEVSEAPMPGMLPGPDIASPVATPG
jgi:hypothetical protein